MLNRTRHGFTLIELLVVIAIIAILASILFPVFARARDKARQAACMSNMKQINLATLQYVQDFDETWPISCAVVSGANYHFPMQAADTLTTPSPAARSMYANALEPYIKSWAVWGCPSGDDHVMYGEPESVLGQARFSYMYNGYLNAWPDANTPQPADTVSYTEAGRAWRIRKWMQVFPYPSQSCAGGDSVPYQFAACHGAIGLSDPGCLTSQWIHGEGGNYAYMDGHVKWEHNPSKRSSWATTVDTSPYNQVNYMVKIHGSVIDYFVLAPHAPMQK